MLNSLLICTDLDRTLIPNGIQPESANARKLFSYLSSLNFVTLVYVTGRDIDLVNKAIKSYHLPVADYVIADVGASIYQYSSGDSESTVWQFLPDWQKYYQQDWNFKTNNEIAVLFSDLADLKKQELNKQKNYKLSYYIPLYSRHQQIVSIMQERLHKANIEAELIYSVDEPNAIGLLDVMPKHAMKKNAIEYLMELKQFDYNNTIFSGDSGNDLDVLISSINSTLVANAHDEVKQQVMEKMKDAQFSSTSYLAKGGILGMNGNYSAGILEGICHFFPKILPLLKQQEVIIQNDSK